MKGAIGIGIDDRGQPYVRSQFRKELDANDDEMRIAEHFISAIVRSIRTRLFHWNVALKTICHYALVTMTSYASNIPREPNGYQSIPRFLI